METPADEVTQAVRPCVFFDRDGIVNEPPVDSRYVLQVNGFVTIPYFFDALAVTRERDYAAVIVTNQKGVGSGLMTIEDLAAIHRELLDQIRARNLEVLDILSCTDTDDGHPWRKPNPGMLLEAADRHGLDLRRSWMIGDHIRDVEAGGRAGCRTVLVSATETTEWATHQLASMRELPGLLAHSLEAAGS